MLASRAAIARTSIRHVSEEDWAWPPNASVGGRVTVGVPVASSTPPVGDGEGLTASLGAADSVVQEMPFCFWVTTNGLPPSTDPPRTASPGHGLASRPKRDHGKS